MHKAEESPQGPHLGQTLRDSIRQTLDAFAAARSSEGGELSARESGRVISVGQGVARLRGLPGVQVEELVRLQGGGLGMVYNLDPDEVGLILLGSGLDLAAGDLAYRTGRILDVPVGKELAGRVVDALGRPLDGRGPIRLTERRPVERPAPPILHRAPVSRPLQTGLKVIDSLLPIGRGQRELILGDRQTGKTAIALDTILNQRGKDVICVYCAIGQRSSAIAGFLDHLRKHHALSYSIVVVATGDEPPGMQYIAPYAATTMAEFFVRQGQDVLIVYDDLTRHARAYRELSLLLRRPPGREAYPGDIFYIHSRLLERSGQLREEHGGGSLTALPISETQAQNISAYIPTNLISITDGQILLSSQLFRKGVLPAVDVGRSVSRIGGKAQLPWYRAVAGQLRLSYAQFEELESFARFGTRLDADTLAQLERGRRVREILQQPQYRPLPVPQQIAALLAASEGLLNTVPVEEVAEAEQAICRHLAKDAALARRLSADHPASGTDRAELLRIIGDAVGAVGKNRHGPVA